MRVLKLEENPYPDKARGWFGSDTEANIDYYAKQEGWREGAQAQYQFLMKAFVGLLEDIFSTAKTDKEVWTKAQELLGNLKQLVE